jgi:ribonucleoside-triphosphate reductase (thioredoxin)
MSKGRKFLSDLKLYSDFLGWREQDSRYETWEEAVKDVFDTHRLKHADKLDKLNPYLEFAEKMYKDKWFLASQRNLQFRGVDILKHEFRLYNCLVMYSDKISFLGNAFYLLLCGCGVGVNMMLPFIERLPKLQARTKGTKTFVIEDDIEGWADAAHVLISSYSAGEVVDEEFEKYKGYQIKFDYSLIRPRGAKVGRRFKAPGHQGLKTALEKIEALLDGYTEGIAKPFKSIIAYDCFMHLADAVLSGGVRRAACSIICSPEDKDLVYAKSGNWRANNPQRQRSNNSVGLIKDTYTKEVFENFLRLNQGMSDIGFVFMNNIFEIFNPCFEIGFTPLFFDWNNQDLVKRIMASDITVLDEGVRPAIQCCNLNEGNGAKCNTKQQLLDMVKAEAITGTIQASYTNFKHLRGKHILEDTIAVSNKEALLGVSIAGFANSPWLFDEEVLKEAALLAKSVNEEVAEILGINPAARITTVKPGGNGPVVLMCASGVTFEHSKRYFRVMQLNKETETAKWLEENMPFLIEESVYNENGTDYVVFIPIENPEGTVYKDEVMGVDHLKKIKVIMDSWIKYGTIPERSIIPTTSHNVSNTVIVDDYKAVTDYIYDHKDQFRAVSFMSRFGDKDYNQCPNTSVLNLQELVDKYGNGVVMASGLVVDALHDFDDNLWEACEYVVNSDPKKDGYMKLIGSRREVLLKKDIIRRFKKFAKNYFKGDLQQTIYCLKDVHLFKKWQDIDRQFKEVDFTKILTKPSYTNLDTMGAQACSGGSCEITRVA